MTEGQTLPPTLDDVRQRFLDAETNLAGIGSTLERLAGAAAGIGEARQSIDQAGTALNDLANGLADTASELEANAVALRQGVDAIRLGDPAEVRRQLSELDAGFTAFQATVIERLTALEARQSKQVETMSAEFEDSLVRSRRAQMETRLGLILVAAIGLAAVAVPLIRG